MSKSRVFRNVVLFVLVVLFGAAAVLFVVFFYGPGFLGGFLGMWMPRPGGEADAGA